VDTFQLGHTSPLLATSPSYLIVADGVMEDLHDVPGGAPQWRTDNPASAVEEFLLRHSDFVLEPPTVAILDEDRPIHVTYWTRG
jgi:cephalosporin hydroxylase